MFGLETLASALPLEWIAYIYWDADPIAFEAGPLTFRWYGLLFAAALLQGYYILRNEYARAGEDPDDSIWLVYSAIAGIILGARFGHVFFYEPERYLANPGEIIKFWKGGLASHGATIGLFVVVIIYTKVVRKIPFRIIADRFALMLPLATACVRLGNFFNSEIVGRVTDVPWAVVFTRVDYQPRHPSQLYEVAMGVTLFFIVWGVDRYYTKREKERPLGLLISIFLVGYFTMRFFVEFAKAYQTLEPGGLTMGQYLSIPFALLGVLGIWACLKGPWKGDKASDFIGKPADVDMGHEVKDTTSKRSKVRVAKDDTLAAVDEAMGEEDESSTGASSKKSKKSRTRRKKRKKK